MTKDKNVTQPQLPDAALGIAHVSSPVTGKIVSNETCLKGKSASFVRHTVIDISDTLLEGKCLVGQAFGVLAPGMNEKGKPHKVRLYSLACPSDGENGDGKVISTTTKREIGEYYPQKTGDDPNDHSLFLGVCSNYLCNLKPGDEVRITGPNGKRFLLPSKTEQHDYLFVATGTGIAPFRGMALELLEKNSTTSQVHLLMGAPYTTDLIYDDLFKRLEKEHKNFHYHTAISREPTLDGGPGQYVHHYLSKHINIFGQFLENPRTLLYICGLAGMQSGLFKVMAEHSIGNNYFTIREKLADIPPSDWDVNQVRKCVKITDRCMVEVY
ncbi:MAG: hypothetical protein CMM56_03025 [Rhodospirillaceae bacterium]|nr:hypothetical protein [Rhodospirillaceae bacterium]